MTPHSGCAMHSPRPTGNRTRSRWHRWFPQGRGCTPAEQCAPPRHHACASTSGTLRRGKRARASGSQTSSASEWGTHACCKNDSAFRRGKAAFYNGDSPSAFWPPFLRCFSIVYHIFRRLARQKTMRFSLWHVLKFSARNSRILRIQKQCEIAQKFNEISQKIR